MICLQLTLLCILLWRGSSKEPEPEPEPVFRPVGSVVEMGYCFGEDYIVVYKVAPEGDLLLGNSSAESPPVTPPVDFRGRVQTSHNHQLLGLQIKNLSHQDSGTYRRECWKNNTVAKLSIQQLTVCDLELQPHEISVGAEDGGVEITCDSSFIGQEGVSVRWYYDVFPTYTISLLLDSRISLEPGPGISEVKNNGAKLVLEKSMLSNNQHFYCLVHKHSQCLSIQDLYMPENSESRNVFASHGDKVFLYCKAQGNNQYWDTPTGRIENTDERSHHMFISTGEESQLYSLVIHKALDEHFGDYACVSSVTEVQYSLILCPKKERMEVFTAVHGDVTLRCDIGQVDSYMVYWYRRQASGEEELIYDSGDDSVPVPENLQERVILHDEDSQLTILGAQRADEGLYWCVVIKGAVFLEDEDEYEDNYEEEEGEDGSDWEDNCLFKQETYVSVTQPFTAFTPEAPKSNSGPRLLKPSEPQRNGQAQTGALVKLIILSVVGLFIL